MNTNYSNHNYKRHYEVPMGGIFVNKYQSFFELTGLIESRLRDFHPSNIVAMAQALVTNSRNAQKDLLNTYLKQLVDALKAFYNQRISHRQYAEFVNSLKEAGEFSLIEEFAPKIVLNLGETSWSREELLYLAQGVRVVFASQEQKALLFNAIVDNAGRDEGLQARLRDLGIYKQTVENKTEAVFEETISNPKKMKFTPEVDKNDIIEIDDDDDDESQDDLPKPAQNDDPMVIDLEDDDSSQSSIPPPKKYLARKTIAHAAPFIFTGRQAIKTIAHAAPNGLFGENASNGAPVTSGPENASNAAPFTPVTNGLSGENASNGSPFIPVTNGPARENASNVAPNGLSGENASNGAPFTPVTNGPARENAPNAAPTPRTFTPVTDRQACQNIGNFEYMESNTSGIEHKLALAKVDKLAGANAFGVFATDAIRKDTLLGEYLGEVLDDDKCSDNSYAFLLSNKSVISALKKGNWTRFINHSDAGANLTLYEENNRIFFRSSMPIKKGEQLLFHYGPGYFSRINIIPVTLFPDDGVETNEMIYQANIQSYKKIEKIGNNHYWLPINDLPALPCDQEGRIINDPLKRKTALHIAVQKGDIAAVVKLRESPDKHQVTENNQTALHLANTSEMVDLLLKAGLNPNAQQFDGKTALHLAIERNDTKSAALLLKTTDLSLKCTLGDALHLAIHYERTEIIDALLQSDAVINFDNHLLHAVARMKDHKTCLSLLINLLDEASLDTFKKCCKPDENNQTPLNILYEMKHMKAAQFILKQCDHPMMEKELRFYMEQYHKGNNKALEYIDFLTKSDENVIDRLVIRDCAELKAELMGLLWPLDKVLQFLDQEREKHRVLFALKEKEQYHEFKKKFLRKLIAVVDQKYPELKDDTRFVYIVYSLKQCKILTSD